MKTYFFQVFLSLSLFSLSLLSQDLYAQIKIIGKWEGTFMNDFIVVVQFNSDHQNENQGYIKMFSKENMIQDDELVNIHLSDDRLTFYIPAKETAFQGSFNTQMSELSGNFVFPDGSKHPIQLSKSNEITPSRLEYEKLKEEKYNVEKLNSDLEFLYSKLQEYHPQLHLFTSKDSLDAISSNVRSQIYTSLTLEEFYKLASKFTDAVHCSHTGIRLPARYQKLSQKFGNYFPCKLFFSEGKAFYVKGCKEINGQVTPGQEIISINNISISEMIDRIFPMIAAEGCNSTTKYNLLNRKFNELFYYLSDSTIFNLKYRSGDSIQSISISASSLENVHRNLGAKEIDRNLDFTYLDDLSTGLLTVPTFAIQNMDKYFHELDSIFRVLQENQTKSLILDLRDNEGGHPIFAAQLLSYLTEKDFTYFKRNNDIHDFEPLYNIMQANKLNFRGDIYVLVNGGCLSTTGHLLSLIKFHTPAAFVGEEPGSSFRCNDFSMQFTLPHTGLEVNIPRTTFETAVEGFNICEPFPIDSEIASSVKDIINGEDRILESIKTIIKNK